MRGIRLSHGAIFITDGRLSVRYLPTGECGPSPIPYFVLEHDFCSEPPNTWDYVDENFLRALPDHGYEKICAAFEKSYKILNISKSDCES